MSTRDPHESRDPREPHGPDEQDLHLHHLVQPYVDDELSPEEAAMVAAYLERSAAGRAAAMQQREVQSLLRTYGEREWAQVDTTTSSRVRGQLLAALDEIDARAAAGAEHPGAEVDAETGRVDTLAPGGARTTRSGTPAAPLAAAAMRHAPQASGPAPLHSTHSPDPAGEHAARAQPRPRALRGPLRAILRGASAMIPAAAAASLLFFVAARGLPSRPSVGAVTEPTDDAIAGRIDQALSSSSPGAAASGRLLTTSLPDSIELVTSDTARRQGGGTVELFDHERGESVLARRVALRALPAAAVTPEGRAWRLGGEVYHVGRDRLGRTVVEFDARGVRHHLHYVGGERQRAALVGLEERDPDPTRDEDARALVRLAAALRDGALDPASPGPGAAGPSTRTP